MSTSSTHKAATVPTGYLEPLHPSSVPPREDRGVDNRYLAGDVIADRYRLVKKLGEGGMGVVWVAHSLVLGVDIALKLISASAAGRSVASRMAREAHAAARLGHPALVRVFDFGWTTRGDPFLVMELAQGETLSRVLHRESRIGAVRAVQLLLPICDGIRCAHEKGIVHRDIKPENVFLAADPFGRLQPKLLDFGIAKMDMREERLTQMGTVLGSPEFMSPEQARGDQDVDLRTDVWSTGVMLYEMITGVLPFKHQNYNALMQAILHQEPKPTTDYRAGDPDLWRVLTKALAKKPEERWQSMTEFGEALALWLYEHGVKEDVCGNSIRALWLDGGLSGVRSEIDTGAPRKRVAYEASESSSPSGVPTVITNPSAFDRWRAKARHYGTVIGRHGKPLALAGVGLLSGVAITLSLVDRPAQNQLAAAPAANAEPQVSRAASAPWPATGTDQAANPSQATTNPAPSATPARAPSTATRAAKATAPATESAPAIESAPATESAPETAAEPKSKVAAPTTPRTRARGATKAIRDFGF